MMMSRISILVTILCLVLGPFVVPSHAQTPGLGKLAAQDAMALVAYLDLNNIGARDPDCRGTVFEVSNVNNVIDTEIAGYLRKLALKEGSNPNSSQLSELLVMLKQIPIQRKDGMLIEESLYQQIKQQAIHTYGKANACTALSSMILTVVQQKRLALRTLANN